MLKIKENPFSSMQAKEVIKKQNDILNYKRFNSKTRKGNNSYFRSSQVMYTALSDPTAIKLNQCFTKELYV